MVCQGFNAPKGGNVVLTINSVVAVAANNYKRFNAPKGGNAVLTLHYEYFNQSEQKLTGRSPRRCAPRDDGLAPKGGNVVLTVPQGTLFPVMGKLRVSMPRRAVMLF